MKKIVEVIVLLLLAAIAVWACPTSVRCGIDGGYMYQSRCEYGTGHAVCKFEHTYYGVNGPENHYEWVDCGGGLR